MTGDDTAMEPSAFDLPPYLSSPVFVSAGHAAQLLDALFKDLREWEERHEAQGRVEYSADRRTATVHVDFPAHPMSSWVPRLEDVLHQERVALDRLAWDISQQHCSPALTPQEENQVYFPMCLTEADFDKKVGAKKGWLSKLDPEYVRRFKLTQPYHASDPKRSLLYWAADYENKTKHREPMTLRHIYDEVYPIYYYDADAMHSTQGSESYDIEWLALGAALTPGIALFQLRSQQPMGDIRVEMVPTSQLVLHDDLEADLEETFHKLHAQMLASVFAVYEGVFPTMEEILYAPGSPMAEHRDFMQKVWGDSYRPDWVS